MSEFLIPDTVRVINTASNYPLELRDAADAVTATATDATGFRVQGVVNTVTKLADITKFRIKRGLSAQQAQYTVAAADLTVAGTVPENSKVFFEFFVENINRSARTNRGTGYEYGVRPMQVDVTIGSADTAATVLGKLHAGINAFANLGRDFIFTSTVTAGTETAPTAIRLDFVEPGTFLKSTKVLGEDNRDSTLVTGFPAAVTNTVKVSKGIGTGGRLEFYQKIKEGNAADVRFFDFGEIPDEGSLYTEIAWTVEYNRKDPKSSELSNKKTFVLYVRETTGEAYVDAFADLLLSGANLAKMTKLEAEGGVTVGFNDAEAITAAANAAAGELDNTDYKITYRLGQDSGTDPKYLTLESIAVPADAEGNATVLAKVKENA